VPWSSRPSFRSQLGRQTASGRRSVTWRQPKELPIDLPLDTDHDLLVLNDNMTLALGEVTQLSGRILDTRGHPIRAALVKTWQVDHQCVYLHNGSKNAATRDKDFQGFGRFMTGSTGEYCFRTI
jgi:protocatechuate 3,4-dioxygenase beta subunit